MQSQPPQIKMIKTDHAQALVEFKATAEKKQITGSTTLTDDGISANKKRMDTEVSNFDTKYADIIISGLKDAISEFEKASNNKNDPDIRNWAASMLPKLRKHLNQSITCQKQCDKV